MFKKEVRYYKSAQKLNSLIKAEKKKKKNLPYKNKFLFMAWLIILLENDIMLWPYSNLSCRKHQLHLCRGVRPPPQRVSWI